MRYKVGDRVRVIINNTVSTMIITSTDGFEESGCYAAQKENCGDVYRVNECVIVGIEQTLKYKAGDKVRIRNKSSIESGWEEEASEYFGTIMTIDYIAGVGSFQFYRMKEDNGYWYWSDKDIVGKVDDEMFKKEDLKNGMLIETKNGIYLYLENIYKNSCDSKPKNVLLELRSHTSANFDLEFALRDAVKIGYPMFISSILNDNCKIHKVVWETPEVKKYTKEEIEDILREKIEIVESK